MVFSESISSCFAKYGTFDGRASRSEFWWFYLFSLLLGWGASIAGAAAMGAAVGSVVQMIVSLVLMVPSLAVSSRRLHDTNHSGWLQLLCLTIVGAIPVIIWWAQPGIAGDNQYGPPPRS